MSSDRLRGQSNVIGVALLLAITVIALGTLTAAIGGIVSDNAAAANAERVATDLDDALRPVETTGVHSGQVSFSEGSLTVETRTVRVLDEEGIREEVRADALIYEQGTHRVVFLAGAVVHQTGAVSRMHAEPPITASRGTGGVLIVGAPALTTGDITVASTQPTTLTMHTDVSHERVELGDATYRVAIETDDPEPWREYFERQGATVEIRQFDGDDFESVVASYPGERTGYLVVHEMNLTIRHGSGSLGGEGDE